MNETLDPVDLTLTFGSTAEDATVRWESYPLGVRHSLFVSPYRGDDLLTVVRALDVLQYPSYPIAKTPDQELHFTFSEVEQTRLAELELWSTSGCVRADAVHIVGRALYKALCVDPEGDRALDTVRNHASANGQSLAFHFRFPPNTIALAALPWETLWGAEPAPLLLSRGQLATCTRHLDLAEALPPPRVSNGPLRILAIVPQQRISERMRILEREARTTAWQPLIESGQVVMTEVSPATRDALVDAIQAGPPPDIVHYYGHGRYKNGQGALLLDGSDETPSWTSVDRLMTLLGGARLVVLHACQGAMVNDTADEHSLLTGVAPALSAAGVPLVIGMQLTIGMRAATRATAVLYRALASGSSVQIALNQARQALYIEEEKQSSWYVPVLYIRSRDIGPVALMNTRPKATSPGGSTTQTIVARRKSAVRNVDQVGSSGAQQDIRAEENSLIERAKQHAAGPSKQTMLAKDESEVTDATQDDRSGANA